MPRTHLTAPPVLRAGNSPIENTIILDIKRSTRTIARLPSINLPPICILIVKSDYRESELPSLGPPMLLVLTWLTLYLPRYYDTVNIDPYHTLKTSMEGRIKNFFHWMCNNYSVKKISSVETYWHQLSQLYIRWKGRRINPLTLKQIYNVYKEYTCGSGTSNIKSSSSTVHWPRNTPWTPAKPTSLS